MKNEDENVIMKYSEGSQKKSRGIGGNRYLKWGRAIGKEETRISIKCVSIAIRYKEVVTSVSKLNGIPKSKNFKKTTRH